MSDWDVNDPGVAARAAISDGMNACMHRSECRRLADENEVLRQQLANAESDCRQRIRRDRMYCMSHGNEAVQQLVAENAELRQRLAHATADGAKEYKDELLKSVKVLFRPHLEGVFAVVDRRLRREAPDD